MKGEFTAIYERPGDWYIGYVTEVPGVNSQGATLDEVRANLGEASVSCLKRTRRGARRAWRRRWEPRRPDSWPTGQ